MVQMYEFCPKCQGIRSASATIGLQKTVHPDGLEGERVLLNLHCDACNTYIRSFIIVEEPEVTQTNPIPLYVSPEEQTLHARVGQPV